MPGLVLKYSQKLSQPVVDRLKKRFEAMYSGPENAGRTLILDEGADVTVAGSTLEQLQYVAVQAAGETRICAAAHGPGGGHRDRRPPVRVRVTTSWRSAGSRTCGRARTGGWRARRCSTCSRRDRRRRGCGSTSAISRRCGRVSWPAPRRRWSAPRPWPVVRRRRVHPGQRGRRGGVGGPVAAGPGPEAPPAGVSGRESATSTNQAGRPPQAALPQDLPGVVAKNLPNAKPGAFSPMPLAPNGSARG